MMTAMVIISEYIVVLWMLPVTVFLILPLCIFIMNLLFTSSRHMALKLRDVSSNRHAGQPAAEARDSRKDQRIAVKGLRADISDGITTYNGLVANISKLGICLKDVPEKLSTSRSLLSIIIHSSSGNFKIVARPRWNQLQANSGKTIGVEIASSPDNWGDFVLSH